MTIHSMGIIHPAAIQRGQFGWEYPTRRALRRFATSLTQPTIQPPNPTQVVEAPGALLFPTPLQIADYLESPLCKEGLVVDIENPGDRLKMVGFSRLADLATIVVWFETRDGTPCWDDHRELVLVRSLVAKVLADPTIPKWGHNLQQHDFPYLERYGFPVRGFGGDTLLMLRHAFPEQPAGLQWATLQYVPDATPWKFWVRWDEEEGDLEDVGK